MAEKIDDKLLAKMARAAIASTQLDISELNVSSSNGFIELSGKVRAAKGHTGTKVRREFENLKSHIRTVRGIKDVYGDRVAVFE